MTEYRPRAAFDLFTVPLAFDFLGTGADVYLEGEASAATLYREYDDRESVRGTLTDRLEARGRVIGPWSLGPVRVTPELGGGITDYSEGISLTRLDVTGGVRAAIDFFRLYPEARSGWFELDGIRHIIDVSAGWRNRFAVTDASEEIVVQDPADLLDELEAYDLRVRNRFQTKRAGEIVDFVDIEIRGVFFPEKMPARPVPFGFREEFEQGISALLLPEEERWRRIPRHGMGPLTAELRAQVRQNLYLAADAWYEFETRKIETASAGVRYEALPGLAWFLGYRAIRGDSSVVTAWADFRLTNRWSARVFQQTNLRRGDGLASGVILRRHLHDFILEFGFRHNAKERETSFTVSIEPTVFFEVERRRTAEDLSFEDMRWYR